MLEDEYYRIAEEEHRHWWYKSLHNLVYAHLIRHFDSKEIVIIDAGCGTGGLIAFLNRRKYKNVSGFDTSETAVKISKQNGIHIFQGDLKNISEYYKENGADVIINNDTFYFLNEEEQKNVTNEMHRLLRTNGLLITNMPSLSAFRGIHDLQVSIGKRFGRNDIWKIFDVNKYSLVAETYWPFLLSPVIWIFRATQRLRMRYAGGASVKSDVRNGGRLLNSILFSITNTENHILSRKPFGSSLFLVMKRK